MKLPFCNGHTDFALILFCIYGHKLQFSRLTGKILERNSLGKCLYIFLSHNSPNLSQISLVHMTLGWKKIMGQLTIIGQEQKTMRVNIQASYWENFLAPSQVIQQVQNGSVLRILSRWDDSFGLVHHVVDKLFILQHLPIKANLISFFINLQFSWFFFFTIYRHAPSLEQVFDLSPTPHSAGN